MPSYSVTKPSWFSSTQELRQNGNIIGELTMLKKMSYALAEARMPGRTIRFGYSGWTARTLFIRDSLDKDIAAVQSLSWWKRDTAVVIDGKSYEWRLKNLWGTRCGWFTADGREIMEFRMSWWSFTLDIESFTQLNETEMMLVFFGIYLTKLQEMDAATSGT